MRLNRLVLAALAAVPVATMVLAQEHGQAHAPVSGQAPYAGQDARVIKSLSASDIEQIRAGAGWGLALPAELNGLPGPAHLLELQREIGLEPAQVAEIERIHAQMQQQAIAAGERFIAAEAALDAGFTGGGLTPTELRRLVAEAAEARAALRFVHLSRHLDTPALLTAAQIERYKVLRGYAADPCATVPDGHDPEMWRTQNHCG